MTQRTKTQLSNRFQSSDPQNFLDDLLDSILVANTAFTTAADITVGAAGDYVRVDDSANCLEVDGSADQFVNAVGDGDGSFDVGGTFSNVTNGTAISGYFKVKVNGTLFKVPFYADT